MFYLIRNPDILPHLDFNNLKTRIGSFDSVFATDRQINHITGGNNSLYPINHNATVAKGNSSYFETSYLALIFHSMSGIQGNIYGQTISSDIKNPRTNPNSYPQNLLPSESIIILPHIARCLRARKRSINPYFVIPLYSARIFS